MVGLAPGRGATQRGFPPDLRVSVAGRGTRGRDVDRIGRGHTHPTRAHASCARRADCRAMRAFRSGRVPLGASVRLRVQRFLTKIKISNIYAFMHS